MKTGESPISSTEINRDEASDIFEFPSNSSTSSSPSKASSSARRQTAIYPNLRGTNKPLKPFSRSAAKRESVMALGSIEYLQHYFTKSGIAAKHNPFKPNSGSRPAIGGGGGHLPMKQSLGGIQELSLPETPTMPSFYRPPFPQVEKTYETDPENIKPGLIRDLIAVSEVWCIDKPAVEEGRASNGEHNIPSRSVDLIDSPLDVNSRLGDTIDVLSTLQATTKLIRSVRNYVVYLPADDCSSRTQKTRNQSPFRTSAFSAPVLSRRVVSNPIDAPTSLDPLSKIRRFALEVLTALRALEESARLPLSDEAYDAQSDHASSATNGSDSTLSPPGELSPTRSQMRSPVPSEGDSLFSNSQDATFSAISVVSVPGRAEAVHVWADDDFSLTDYNDDEKPTREIWDERLVLGSGWLYRRDIVLGALVKERDCVTRYLDIVDEVLFGGRRGDGRRGWENEEAERKERPKGRGSGRRVSHGSTSKPHSRSPDRSSSMIRTMDSTLEDLSLSTESTPDSEINEDTDEEEVTSVDNDRLPEWARRLPLGGDHLTQVHKLLLHVLPSASKHLLVPSEYNSFEAQSRMLLLDALSSGQILCIAYNACVRRSRKPWGYVNRDSIHDIATLEANAAAEIATVAVTGGAGEEKRTTTKGWTFRRTDNLRLWAAALKLRYLLPLVSPATSTDIAVHGDALKNILVTPKTASTSMTASASAVATPAGSPSGQMKTQEPQSASILAPSPAMTLKTAEMGPGSLLFDAKVVARKDEGWEEMLEAVVLRWVDAVVDEERRRNK